MRPLPARAKEMLRFAAVGATSTILYLALYGAMILAGLPLWGAVVVAFTLSAGVGYLGHRQWTFRSPMPSGERFHRWLLIQGGAAAANIAALEVVTAAGVARFAAQVLVLPLIPFATYALGRRHVFEAQ